MGYISSFLNEFRKRRRLRKLSRVLGELGDINATFSQAAKEAEVRDQAREQLLDLCESDPFVLAVMEEFGADRDSLRKLYRDLVLAGAGQWAKGHFVAASAIANPWTLEYCLRATSEGSRSSARLAYDMTRYFQGHGKDSLDT